MLPLVLAISFMMSRNLTFKASDFFLRSSYPFFAPTRFVCHSPHRFPAATTLTHSRDAGDCVTASCRLVETNLIEGQRHARGRDLL